MYLLELHSKKPKCTVKRSRLSVNCGPDGGCRIADSGWQAEKFGWKNVDDKMRVEIANDNMRVMQSLWGEMNLRCVLTVSHVNNPDSLTPFFLHCYCIEGLPTLSSPTGKFPLHKTDIDKLNATTV